MTIGSFMPWVSMRSGLGSIDMAGTEGDGVFTLVLGVLAAILALVHLDRPAPKGVRGLIVLAGFIGLAVFFVDYSGLAERIADADADVLRASVGAGMYIMGLGSLAAAFGAIRMSSPSLDAEKPPRP